MLDFLRKGEYSQQPPIHSRLSMEILMELINALSAIDQRRSMGEEDNGEKN